MSKDKNKMISLASENESKKKSEAKTEDNIKTTFFIILIGFLLYLRFFGFQPIDDFLDRQFDNHPVILSLISLLIIGILMFESYLKYKKGDKDELANLMFPIEIFAIAFVILFVLMLHDFIYYFI